MDLSGCLVEKMEFLTNKEFDSVAKKLGSIWKNSMNKM